jgi:hypothetical protein
LFLTRKTAKLSNNQLNLSKLWLTPTIFRLKKKKLSLTMI